jgi:hypothetical protein
MKRKTKKEAVQASLNLILGPETQSIKIAAEDTIDHPDPPQTAEAESMIGTDGIRTEGPGNLFICLLSKLI